jgi:ABC-type multidrug transport system fused ATPase/permease subunit
MLKNKNLRLVVRSFSYLRPYARQESLVFLLMISGVLLTLPQPLVTKFLIDDVLTAGHTSLLSVLILVLLGAFALQSLLTWYHNYLANSIYQKVLLDVRRELYDHLQRLTPVYYNTAQTGDSMARVLNDAMSLSTLIATVLSRLLTEGLTLLVILSLMLYFDWKLTLLSLAMLPFFVLSLLKFNKRIRASNEEMAIQRAMITGFLQEAIGMLKLTQMFNKEGFMSGRFLRQGKNSYDANMKAIMVGTKANLLAGVFMFLGPLSVLYIGALHVVHGALTVGSLIAFYAYLGRVYGPINSLAGINVEVQTALAGIGRVFHLLDAQPDVKESPQPKQLAGVSGEIEFRGVSFSYPGRPDVLREVSFTARAGAKIALVGPSGAGKTTVIDLLYRFYDPSAGAIYLDGHDIRDLRLDFLRRQLSIVSQDTFLFDDTIYENLAFGKDGATRDEIEAAAAAADIHDFIKGLPDGYATVIGERGVKLSGGQKQRIAIARAVLRDSRVIVLDEATSSLDSIGERKVQAALEKLVAGKTVIVIAHRFSTIQQADSILALREGQIVAEGTHPELMETSGLYQELYSKQFQMAGT